MKLPPKPAVPARQQLATLPDRLMLIFDGGAREAQWKVHELQQQHGRRWPGEVPDSTDMGHALTILMANKKIRKVADAYTRHVEVEEVIAS